MDTHTFSLAVDGAVLKGTAWLPENPSALMLIEHGMAEHHLRYADFAAWLVSAGVGVYAYDKRGHGQTAGPSGSEEYERSAGWFAHRHGWKTVVNDSLAILELIRGQHDLLPLFVFGHSMGSFVARDLVADPRCGKFKLAGLILSGTAGPAGNLGTVGRILAWTLIHMKGATRASPFLDKMASGKHAQLVTGDALPRTPFEWLSRDTAEVDKYIADPYSGNVMATSFYRDLLVGLASLFTPAYAKRFPRDLPVLMYSGDCDPVGGMGVGVSAVAESYRAWGLKDFTFKLYPGGRHEMHNETNRQEVYELVSGWLSAHIERAR